MTLQLFLALNNSSTLHLGLLLPPQAPSSVPFYQFPSLVLKFLCWVVPITVVPYHTHMCACTHTDMNLSQSTFY